MDNVGKFWATVWALVAVVSISVIVATFAYHVQRDDKIAKMVSAGADPIYAICSLNALREGACLVYTAGDRTR